jgi:hypothetical protein
VLTLEPLEEVPSLEKKVITTEWSHIEIKEEEIKKNLKSVKPGKSPGIDHLQPRLLRELSEEISHPLWIIFDKSLKVRAVPVDWKKAKISAIYKNNNKALAGNYRPVSLTSLVCKLMEKLIRNSIIKHMDRNSLLTTRQYGFMSGRSTANKGYG